MWGSVKKQETLVDEWIRSITAMKLEKMNLKDKAKTIQNYTKNSQNVRRITTKHQKDLCYRGVINEKNLLAI